jgi:hypothetical protein
MMKKLFILMLVLGMASFSEATTISFVDEGLTIIASGGEVVRLDVMSNLGLYGLDASATVTGGDVITGATGKWDCATYGWDPSLSFDPIRLGTAQAEIGLGTFGFPPSGVVAYFDVLYTGGEQIVSIAGGYFWGGSVDWYGEPPPFSDGVVTIIPEPASLALLGLGTLAILRRRK